MIDPIEDLQETIVQSLESITEALMPAEAAYKLFVLQSEGKEIALAIATEVRRRSSWQFLVRVNSQGFSFEELPASSAQEPAQRPPPRRANWLGAPEFFDLNAACLLLSEAFGWGSTYLVGSALHSRDHRDVDIRTIVSDEDFARLFPGAGPDPQHNALWTLMCSSISLWLSRRTNLKIDYQIQQRTDANARFDGERCAIGIMLTSNST